MRHCPFHSLAVSVYSMHLVQRPGAEQHTTPDLPRRTDYRTATYDNQSTPEPLILKDWMRPDRWGAAQTTLCLLRKAGLPAVWVVSIFQFFEHASRNTARRENYIRTVRQNTNNATNSHAPSRVTRANAPPEFRRRKKNAAQLAKKCRRGEPRM